MEKILCNGIPKSGTHALVKTVQLLGVSNTRHGHYSLPEHTPEGVHLFVVRNPKDMMVSWCRMQKGECNTGFLIGSFKQYYNNKSIVEVFNDFAHWLTNDTVFTVCYEDLISDGGLEIARIAEHLGIPMVRDAYANLPGMTFTWTDTPSHWEDYWNVQVQDAWVDAGGLEIERVYGYAIGS